MACSQGLCGVDTNIDDKKYIKIDSFSFDEEKVTIVFLDKDDVKNFSDVYSRQSDCKGIANRDVD